LVVDVKFTVKDELLTDALLMVVELHVCAYVLKTWRHPVPRRLNV